MVDHNIKKVYLGLGKNGLSNKIQLGEINSIIQNSIIIDNKRFEFTIENKLEKFEINHMKDGRIFTKMI